MDYRRRDSFVTPLYPDVSVSLRTRNRFALVSAIAIDPVTGKLTGASDTGSDGMALLVS